MEWAGRKRPAYYFCAGPWKIKPAPIASNAVGSIITIRYPGSASDNVTVSASAPIVDMRSVERLCLA
jgi:hypothetical protein